MENDISSMDRLNGNVKALSFPHRHSMKNGAGRITLPTPSTSTMHARA